jgi:mRNA interferase MazF
VKVASSSSGAPRRPRRGEIWWVDFSPSIGNEIRDEHPALVVSSDQLNDNNFGILIVIPISSSSRPLRIHVDLPAGEAGLRKLSRIKCDQVGKVDIRRFRPKGKIGEIRQETLRRVELVLRRLLEL